LSPWSSVPPGQSVCLHPFLFEEPATLGLYRLLGSVEIQKERDHHPLQLNPEGNPDNVIPSSQLSPNCKAVGFRVLPQRYIRLGPAFFRKVGLGNPDQIGIFRSRTTWSGSAKQGLTHSKKSSLLFGSRNRNYNT
ncbi:hypothetical protein PROFUN_14539, partial [Planoprotostelium fungivorum]